MKTEINVNMDLVVFLLMGILFFLTYLTKEYTTGVMNFISTGTYYTTMFFFILIISSMLFVIVDKMIK